VHYFIIFNDAFLLRPVAGYSVRNAAWAEILYTMALCYVVLNVATTENKEQGNVKSTDRVPNSFYGLAIGLTVTSAAIAVGPISGCSLNPAVSLGALFASKLAHGIMPMSMVGLYCLAPLFGAALATLFFYFVQGGLTGQYEYPMSITVSPPPSQPMSPVPVYTAPVQQPVMPNTCKFLTTGEVYFIPEEAEHHTIFLGVSWKIQDPNATSGYETAGCDIDASCVKMSSKGENMGYIYFGTPAGNEIKRTEESIVVHQGDNLTGKGVGFGFIEDPKRHHKHKNQPAPIVDLERLEIRRLAQLRKHQPRCTYLFFVINVFSSARAFEHLKELCIRMVDQDADGTELCRFSKSEMTRGKFQGNGYVLGVLSWRADRKQWAFQVIDKAFVLPEHGVCRGFETKLREYVREMEGLP
jgi:stress response protein SCP2